MENRSILTWDIEKLNLFFANEATRLNEFLTPRGKKAIISNTKLFSKELELLRETDQEDFAVSLLEICMDIQFFCQDDHLTRLSELGLPKAIRKFLIHHEKISQIINDIYESEGSEKQYQLYLVPTNIFQIIEINNFFQLKNFISRQLLPLETKTGNQKTTQNHLTANLQAISRRKGTFTELLQKLDDFPTIDSEKNKKFVDQFIFQYFGFNSSTIKLSRGDTQKLIISEILNESNFVLINPLKPNISQKELIIRLIPLFGLLLPDSIKSQSQHDKSAERKGKAGYSMDLEDHNYANIRSKILRQKKERNDFWLLHVTFHFIPCKSIYLVLRQNDTNSKRKTMENQTSSPFFMEGDQNLLGGFITAKKAMQLLQCKTTTLYYLRKENHLVFAKIGRKIFYEVKSIQNLLNKHKV